VGRGVGAEPSKILVSGELQPACPPPQLRRLCCVANSYMHARKKEIERQINIFLPFLFSVLADID